MKKNTNNKDYNNQIITILEQLKSVLSSKNTISDSQQIEQLYKLCQTITETSSILGFNSVFSVFSLIEQGVGSLFNKIGKLQSRVSIL